MPKREKLIELATWLGAQKALHDLELPSEWDQHMWVNSLSVKLNGDAKFSCGTAACAAGRTALRAGGEPVFAVGNNWRTTRKRWADMSQIERDTFTEHGGVWHDENDEDLYVEMSDSHMSFPSTVPGRGYYIESIPIFAANELGLFPGQASRLFSADNTYDHMIGIIRRLIHD